MPASRRVFVTGLASLPVTVPAFAAATTAAASVDPIVAVIARHRDACALLESIDEAAAPAAYDAAEHELCASADMLADTVPQTMAGARALLNFAIDDAERDGEGCLGTLKKLRQALDRLAPLLA